MKRIFLALLLLVLVSLSVPPLRERAMPRYEAGASWLWSRLQGPLSPALTPWRRLETKNEMAHIANQLIVLRNRGGSPPRADELPEFLRQAHLDSTATDRWGSHYDVRLRADSLDLISPGPDLEMDTEDDLVVTIRFPDRGRAGLRRPRR